MASIAALIAGAPAIARSVADFAKNAAHVDGYRAVPSGNCGSPTPPTYPGTKPSCPDRARKLVVTNRNGYLSNDVIRQANDSARLAGYGADRYAMECGDTIAGFAYVPVDTGSSWTQVEGYGYISKSGGAVGPDGKSLFDQCQRGEAFAEHVSTGVYRVAVYADAGCSYQLPQPGSAIPAQVTANDARALTATYVAGPCDADKGPTEEVHVFDDKGIPTDSAFTLTTLEPVRFLYP
jgi:hypothetical protein